MKVGSSYSEGVDGADERVGGDRIAGVAGQLEDAGLLVGKENSLF